MKSFGLLILRLVGGTLLAGHGAQKLFGWFEGPGLQGTGGFMETLGMKPSSIWGPAAGGAEFGGGLLTALGFLNPLGPIGIISAMSVATAKVHWGKPVWAAKGGPELPLINMSIALAVAFAGPGSVSLDRLFGIRLPRWMTALSALAAAGGLVAALKPELVQQVVTGPISTSQKPES